MTLRRRIWAQFQVVRATRLFQARPTISRRPHTRQSHSTSAVRSINTSCADFDMAPRRGQMSNIRKAKKTLILLANSRPKVVKKILKNANNQVIKAISELALNCLNGAVKLSPTQKAKLSRFKKPMRDLSAPQTKLAAKRAILQRGGFVGTLVGVGLPLLIKGITSLVGAIKRKRRQRASRKK